MLVEDILLRIEKSQLEIELSDFLETYRWDEKPLIFANHQRILHEFLVEERCVQEISQLEGNSSARIRQLIAMAKRELQYCLIRKDQGDLWEYSDDTFLTTPINFLDLTRRTYLRLKGARIDSAGDLLEFKPASIECFRAAGKKTIEEIRLKLWQQGIDWGN